MEMGKQITPAADIAYKAVLEDAQGKTQQSAPSGCKEKGIVLSAYLTPDAIQFTIKRQEDGGADYPSVTIVAQSQQQMVYQAIANLSKSSGVRASIPLENIPTGILFR